MTSQTTEVANTILEALGHFGYQAQHIRFGWRVPDAEQLRRYTAEDNGAIDNLPVGNAIVLDALVFSDDRVQDWNTSAIGVDFRHSGAVGTQASRGQRRTRSAERPIAVAISSQVFPAARRPAATAIAERFFRLKCFMDMLQRRCECLK